MCHEFNEDEFNSRGLSSSTRLDLPSEIGRAVSFLAVRSCRPVEICPTLKDMKTSQNKNDYAIWLVVSGIFVYIAADSGIFKKMPSLGEIFPGTSKTATADAAENLRGYANKIQTGLAEAEKQVAQEKTRIEEFQKNAKEIEKSIQEQRKILSLLTDEVENYRKASRLSDEDGSARGPASEQNAKLTPEEAGEIITRITEIPAQVTAKNIKGRKYLRLNTDLQYSSDNDIYLSNTGIRQADTFARAAISMNMDTVVLAHEKNLGSDPVIVSRIHGISSYIKEKFNDKVNVRAVQVSKGSLAEDRALEIWAERAQQ